MEYVDSGQSGMIVMTRDGGVVYLSEAAGTLLHLAVFGALPADGAPDGVPVELPAALRRVCEKLDRSSQGLVAPLVVSHANSSGRFIFHIYCLRPFAIQPDPALPLGSQPPGGGLVGVRIDYQVPLGVRLRQSLQDSRLSVREREVCVALAEGLSRTAIAARLGVTPHTVVTYVRRIYHKLEIHRREELLDKLLSSGVLRHFLYKSGMAWFMNPMIEWL